MVGEIVNVDFDASSITCSTTQLAENGSNVSIRMPVRIAFKTQPIFFVFIINNTSSQTNSDYPIEDLNNNIIRETQCPELLVLRALWNQLLNLLTYANPETL